MSTATPGAAPGFYQRHLKDLLAGCAIAGLLLPEAVAYANIGNVPPQAGIVALIAGLAIYGVIGNSRFAVVSSTSSSAAVLAAVTLSASGGDAATRLLLGAGIIIMAGLFFLIASAARLGNMSDFIAKSVLRGFTFGLAITIVLKQCGLALRVNPTHSDAPRYLWGLLETTKQWSLYGGALAIAALVILYALKRWPRVPATLVVIVLSIVLGYAVDLPHYGIVQVGRIDLAHIGFGLPDLERTQWLRCGELAFAMMLIVYAESYGSIRGFALKHDDPFSPNRDLAALGASNLVSGLFGGMPVGAGYSGTSANEAAGAQTRVAAWTAAAVIALMVALLLPQIAHIPEPVLAAIVIHAVSHTINPHVFAPYLKWRRDRFLALGACLAVLLLGVLDGLLLAIAVSLLWTLRNLSEPKVSVLGRLGDTHDFVDTRSHPDAHPVPGMIIVRPEAPLFFANVERVLSHLRMLTAKHDESMRHTIISLEESADIDGSTIEALQTYAAEVSRDGRKLVLARLKPRVLHVLTRAATDALPVAALNELSVDVCVHSLLDAQATTH
ncbi:SulP family inorganic anion transporter [Paraburkholderia denitrificans]|uniref:SulP family inorganic anion transporter n=1 Tax=Paraburkholderia denitrificans TaxID=694025 RepID=A0ABW0JEW9_9BURK